nr:uncharacterized protein LOC113803883 [Penaeus vannamei]
MSTPPRPPWHSRGVMADRPRPGKPSDTCETPEGSRGARALPWARRCRRGAGGFRARWAGGRPSASSSMFLYNTPDTPTSPTPTSPTSPTPPPPRHPDFPTSPTSQTSPHPRHTRLPPNPDFPHPVPTPRHPDFPNIPDIPDNPDTPGIPDFLARQGSRDESKRLQTMASERGGRSGP